MKIVVYLHMTCPVHQAGSETTVHAAMREMVARGHEATVIADRLTKEDIDGMVSRGVEGFKLLSPTSYEYEGVKVLSIPQQGHQFALVKEYAKDADILVTHLDVTSMAMQLHLDLHKPLVMFVHNHAQLNFHSVPPNKCQLAIFNSNWVAKNQKYKQPHSENELPWPGDSVVIHPIVEPDKYRCERGTKITLCNPTDGKGISTLHKLAEAMPDYEFLVVEGIYGEQIAPPNLGDEWIAAHPNIEHMKNSPDFRDVLKKTKVLLMPSNYESYGRCAVEAACAGIPSIVHPTQGLWEALGDGREYWATAEYGTDGALATAREAFTDGLFAGGVINGAAIFCDRADTDSWKVQLERLYSDEVYYRSRSDAALKLADSLDPEGEFDRLETALLKTIEDWRKKEEIVMPKLWGPSDQRYWETTDGRLVPEVNSRIPSDALRLAVGIGGFLPEEVAIANGIIEKPIEAKAVEAPEENKAISAPEENKAKRGRKTKAA